MSGIFRVSVVHFFPPIFFMLAYENLGIICYREHIGASFLCQKGHFWIYWKNYPHFWVWPWKIKRSPKIILFPNGMSWNLVRMKFALVLCTERCQNMEKCLVTLLSAFSQFFLVWPIKVAGTGEIQIFCQIPNIWPNSQIWRP